MNKIYTKDITADTSFSGELMLDEQFVLLPKDIPLSKDVLTLLDEWNFKEILCEGIISDNNKAEDEQITQENSISEEIDINEINGIVIEDENKTPEEKTKETVQNNVNSEKSRYEYVQKIYHDYMKYINYVYTHYATHKKIDLKELSEKIQQLCVFIRENKRFVLRISPSAEARSKNFLVIHSMRTTVLSITIALEMHISLSKIVELGIASVLHEIGMLKLPPQLYITNRVLSPSEKKQISMHTLYGCNILKEMNFPVSILKGVLEHHEKENGQGYPQRLTSEKISEYAKIISVACSFEAITAPREYKTERTTFDAMVEMLHNPNGQYDAQVIKALLYSLSLYPIGAYIYLNNGKIAVVSDVSPNNPKFPIVQLINEKEGDGTPKTIQTDEGSNMIIRVLSKQEQEDVIKSLRMQMKADEEKQINASTKKTENQTTNEFKQPDEDSDFSSVDISDFQ